MAPSITTQIERIISAEGMGATGDYPAMAVQYDRSRRAWRLYDDSGESSYVTSLDEARTEIRSWRDAWDVEATVTAERGLNRF